VLTRDTHVDNLDVYTAYLGSLLNGGTDGSNGFFNVSDHAAGYPDALALPDTENFDFAKFIASADDAGNLGGSDV
jgi:hypothetical protein